MLERLRERSKVPDLRLHDLRRWVKKILNHAERDVTVAYDRHSYDPEKRTALEARGRRLEAIVIGLPKKAQIVALTARGQARSGPR